ncbi:MAG: DUF2339 domain-containing protein [Pirellulales bacterium]|nr:DUF2339 domain-containing protein [Pirellulales bacterium]
MIEFAVAILIFLMVVVAPLTAIVLGAVAYRRSRQIGDLVRRVEQLEAMVRPAVPAAEESPVVPEIVPEETHAQPAAASPFVRPSVPVVERKPIQWELLVGRKALGWVAVVLLLFAAAFFLRYAFENQWIGPLGRVGLGVVAGAALVAAGWDRHRRGWQSVSQMLTAAGVMVVYLSTYAAFGFYHLLPQQAAGVFLAVLVLESAVLAVLYNSPAIGLTALVGGLLTSLLMHSEHDQYHSLFTYLAVLDAGALGMLVFRAWIGIGSVALLGTQGLFWLWYTQNYHPEKLAWALGFQAIVFVLFLGQSLLMHVVRTRRATWEDLARMVLTASLWFLAFYVLMKPDHNVWMGTAAVAMAVVFAIVARLVLAWRPQETRQLLTALAIAVGFVALAFPIQADAAWVALGWAAEAAVLWWFGNRTRAPAMRAIAGVLALAAVTRVAIVDTPHHTREPFVPVVNEYALPALGTAALVLVAIFATRRLLGRLQPGERFLVQLAGLVGIALVWLVLSVDCHGYFDALAAVREGDRIDWHWLGQMMLSILWALFATALLAIGFRARLARLRWLAIGLYGLTVGKVFLVDMAELDEIYRILAFFVLAVLLGAAAWAYQRIRLEPEPDGITKGDSHEA